MFCYVIMKLIRITADNDDAIRELCDGVPSYVCKEGPDNEKNCRKVHYHLMLDTDMTDNGLRKQIYKYFNVKDEDKGQKTCAFTTVKEEEGCKRYLSKGQENVKPEIIVNTLEVNVDQYYEAYWDIFSSLKKEGARIRKENKSKTLEFLDYFDTVYTGEDNVKSRKTLDMAEVCDVMCEWYRVNEYTLPTKWQGQQLVMTAYNRYSDEKKKARNLRNFYGFGRFMEDDFC